MMIMMYDDVDDGDVIVGATAVVAIVVFDDDNDDAAHETFPPNQRLSPFRSLSPKVGVSVFVTGTVPL